MHKLFEVLSSHGLSMASRDGFAACLARDFGGDRIFGLVEELNGALDRTPVAVAAALPFFAGGSLSGQRHPCEAIACRRRALDTMGRLAALFADTVLIAQPFGTREEVGEIASSGGASAAAQDLADDITLLWDLHPLIEAGIVQITRKSFHYCKSCARRVIAYSARLREAESGLGESVAEEVRFSVEANERFPGTVIMRIEGPDVWVPHGMRFHLLGSDSAPAELRELLEGASSAEVPKEVVNRLHLHTLVTGPAVTSVLLQHLLSEGRDAMYLSDMEVDFEILRCVSEPGERLTTDSVLAPLSHRLPVPLSVDVGKVVKLRQDEPESFQVYRDGVRACLREAAKTGPADVEGLVRDRLAPEIHRIELTLKNNKRALLGSAARDLAIGTLFVSVGVFSGFLAGDARLILQTLGGYGVVSSMAKTVSSAFGTPKEVRENPFYFLWKASQKPSKAL